MLVYIVICSLIGSISVVFTQGLGSAIVHTITNRDENQFTNWFIYVVLGIVIVTLIIEIVYLNKALNLFNTALVTPTYYVIFTTLTIVSSIVLYRGFDTSAVNIATCVLGFLCICSGIALLHNSRGDLTSSLEQVIAPTPPAVEDEEKVLISEKLKSENSLKSRHMLELFENKIDNNDDVAAVRQDIRPGAADLFAAPFSGISRYASTTKRSQTIIAKQRLNNNLNPEKIIHRSHANTISIGNTVNGEEGYSREIKWKDQSTSDSNEVSGKNKRKTVS